MIKWFMDNDDCCLKANVFSCHHLALTKAHRTVQTGLDRVGLLYILFQ